MRAAPDAVRLEVHDDTAGSFSLARLLASELGVEEAAVRIDRGVSGKPYVRWPRTDLRFSISRSRGVVALAIARSVDVGVDIESLERRVIGWALWRHVLSPAECADLPAAPTALNSALLRAWTGREAILKAAGVGLGVDPREIELSPAGTIQRLPSSFATPEDWSLTYLVADGIVGAVACRPQRGALTA